MNSDIFGGKYVRKRVTQRQHHDSSDYMDRPNIRRRSFNVARGKFGRLVGIDR